MEAFTQFFKDFALAISPALNVLLQSVFVALAALAAAWVKKQFDLAKAKLSDNETYALDMFIEMAVKAAQQVYNEQDGAGKKAYVLNLVEQYALKAGLVIDVDELDAKIEAAVFNHLDVYPKVSQG